MKITLDNILIQFRMKVSNV